MRLKKLFKARWKKKGRLDGSDLQKIQVKPDPLLKEITFNIAEEGLTLLGVSIEDFIAGRTCKPVPPMSPDKGAQFLGVVLTNAHKYDLGSMALDRAQGLITTVAAAFFFECTHSVRGRYPGVER